MIPSNIRKIGYCLVLTYVPMVVVLAIASTDFKNKNDSYDQALVAESLFQGRGITFNERPYVILPPGYSIVIGLVNAIVQNPEWGTKVIGVTSFIASIYVLHLILFLLLKDELWVVVGMLLYASNSNVLINAASGRSESFFCLIFLTFVYWLLRKPGLSVNSLILISGGSAALYYVRPEGLLIGLVLLLWLLFWSQEELGRKILFSLIAAMAILVLIFPYLFFLKEQTGRWQLSGKTYVNLVMGELHSPFRDKSVSFEGRYAINEQVQIEPKLAKGLFEYWDEPENDLYRRIPANLQDLAVTYWFTFSIGLVVILGGMIGSEKEANAFLLSLFAVVVVYIPFFVTSRILAIFHWILISYLVFGFKNLHRYLSSRFNERRLAAGMLVIVGLEVLYEGRSAVKIIYNYVTS